MTKQQFLELYGKSVYQVYLEIAAAVFCQQKGKSPKECLQEAHYFVEDLLEEEIADLKGLYD